MALCLVRVYRERRKQSHEEVVVSLGLSHALALLTRTIRASARNIDAAGSSCSPSVALMQPIFAIDSLAFGVVGEGRAGACRDGTMVSVLLECGIGLCFVVASSASSEAIRASRWLSASRVLFASRFASSSEAAEM